MSNEELKNDLESKMADLMVTIEINHDAFETISDNLGKKGLHRVLSAGILYPEPPKVKLQSETELECYTLLQDILNAKFSVSLINMALREVDGVPRVDAVTESNNSN